MNLEEKKLKAYQTKALSLKVEDIDAPQRIVKGWLSAFNVRDSDWDILRKGTFKKSIEERGPGSPGNRKITHLYFHDWKMPIGVYQELEEKDFGLFFIAKMGTNTNADDRLRDYEEGLIREHSIGFNYVPDRMKWVDDEGYTGGGYWDVTEVKLYEGSAVLFGANEHTPVEEVIKSEGIQKAYKDLSEKMNSIQKALANGKGTDERLYKLELRLKFLQTEYDSLFETLQKPDVKSTLKTKLPDTEALKEEEKRKFLLKMLS